MSAYVVDTGHSESDQNELARHQLDHREDQRNGAPLYAFLHSVGMNLPRNSGYRSVDAGQQELSRNIRRILAMGGVAASTG